jgi:PTS system nitrogen regulatory IIA component
MTLHELVRPDSVLSNVEARSKKHAIEILSELLSHGSEDVRQQDIFAAITDRERLGCTALGRAVAAPHARLADAPHPIGALLKLSSSVDFDTPDDEPVDLIFGVIFPEDVDDAAIEDFRELTEMLSRPGIQARLRKARSSRELYEALMAEDPPGAAGGVAAGGEA